MFPLPLVLILVPEAEQHSVQLAQLAPVIGSQALKLSGRAHRLCRAPSSSPISASVLDLAGQLLFVETRHVVVR